MKERKRGVSPVIATVILISIVVVLAIILFLWFRSMTREAITKFDGQNVEILCGDVSFSARYLDEILYISNEEVVPIYQMQLYASGGGKKSEISWIDGNQWPVNGISSGRAMSGRVDFNGFTDAKEIILVPVLLGISETGQKAYVCDEKKYGKRVEI